MEQENVPMDIVIEFTCKYCGYYNDDYTECESKKHIKLCKKKYLNLQETFSINGKKIENPSSNPWSLHNNQKN